MSQEHVEAVRRVFEGWTVGDFTASESLMDPNVTLVVTRTFPTEGVWIGHDGLREHMAQVLDAWDSLTMTAKSFREAGDTVLVSVHQRGVGSSSGVPVEMEYFQLWSFRAGRVIRLEVIADEAEALEAVGLRE
ncbi:MAG: nuclear transport factor 2 family protein [Actinomycetota bacterium]|nr:nuclear transport factor 2 family protein [Actinomycetota bacterium]